jgi:hypothetical protein
VFLLPIAVLAVPPAGLNVPIAVYLVAPAFIWLLWVDYTERRKNKRKKENFLNQNSLGSASRRTFTESRKTKKNLFLVHKNTKKIS